MTHNPYQAPTAPVRDLSPSPPGRITDWIVVIAAVIVSRVLTQAVVPEIAAIVFWDVLKVPFYGVTPGFLWTDVVVNTVGHFAVFYLGAMLVKGRPTRLIALMTALTLVATVAWRWLDGDYEPSRLRLWYEVALLLATALAGLVAFLLYRRRVGPVGHAHAA